MPRPPERRPWLALAISVALHGLLFLVVIEGRPPVLPHRPPALIVLAPPMPGPEAVPMPYRRPQAMGSEGTGISGDRPAPRALRPRPQSVAELPQPEPRRPPADTGSAPAPRPRVGIGSLRPELGGGRLWVRPLPLPPKELAQRLRKTHVELVDSAVTAIVQGYLDSIAADPAARAQALPSWTKEIAGRKFGIDAKNIYIAGLKIPAAVLALLPIPAGNVDQNRAYNHLMDLRSDLEYAAQRAENLEEFKSMIKEMRLRKEREREFEQNQRTSPSADPTSP